MTETEARRAWLLRAFEQPASAPWSAEDADAVTRQALQQAGEDAAPAHFIGERARLGVERLAQREPAVAAALAATGPQPGLARAIVALAAIAGAAADAVGTAQRINILAPPLLALLLWNLAVYAALAWSMRRARPEQPAEPGPLRSLLVRWARAAAQRAATPAGSTAAAPLSRFIADAWRSSASLNASRLAGLLHAAAAAFAAAALASLYVRGLGLEYRAGWDSTFLTPAAVHQLLALLFAPALALTGGTLPGADALARLRFSAGPGENAAGWIHLQALTIALFVVLPRTAFAGLAAWRVRHLENDATLPLDDPYFARLARLPSGASLTVDVLPYSYRLPTAALPALQAALESMFGGRVQLRLAEPVPLGGEDGATRLPASDRTTALLFALTATPERETHGAFVAATGARRVLVDEAGFRQRFTGGEGAGRLDQRRAAWRRMLGERGVEPHFFDLGQP